MTVPVLAPAVREDVRALRAARLAARDALAGSGYSAFVVTLWTAGVAGLYRDRLILPFYTLLVPDPSVAVSRARGRRPV